MNMPTTRTQKKVAREPTTQSGVDLSLIVITYNYGPLVGAAIESCIEQRKCGAIVEIIVIDDGSTDNTTTVLSAFDSSDIRRIRLDNSGIERAANAGLRLATGEFVARVDADDQLHHDYWSTMRRYLYDTKFDFTYTDYNEIDKLGTYIKGVSLPPFCHEEILNRGDFLATGTCWRKSSLEALNFYDTSSINSGLENYELVLRAIDQNYQGMHIPIPLFDYRIHSGSISQVHRSRIESNGRSLFTSRDYGIYKWNEYHPQYDHLK